MQGLLTEFWPLTMTVGFVDAPLARVRDAAAPWLREVRGAGRPQELGEGALRARLPQLEPLSYTWTRMLLQQTRSPWTALLLNNSRGADAVNPVSHLCELLKVRGLVLSSIPQLELPGGQVSCYGQVRFDLFAAGPGFFLNHERTVYAMNDGGRWTFAAQGAPQSFEEPEAYKARKIRDRFTPEMLVRYGRALGVALDDPDFFTGDAVLLKAGDKLPPGQKPMSLREARAALGLAA